MSQGWICLHRKLLDWEWYSDANTTRLFIHCLLRANHKPKNWRGVDIERGQFWTSLDTLSKETGLTVKKIRTSISKLERTSDVASYGHAKGRMITVLNYDLYQEDGKLAGRERARKGQAKGKQRATNNNDNNENNENKKEKRAKISRFVKPTLQQLCDYQQQNNLMVDCEYFFNHYESNGWKVGRNAMKDWQKTMQNWSRREQKNGSSKQARGNVETAVDWANR